MIQPLPKSLRRMAVVIRGPAGAGKTSLRNELARTLSKELRVRCIILDKHSGISSNHRPRSYHNLDSLSADCVLVELGNGGDATRNPQTWVNKLRSQGYSVHLFLLDAPLGELKERTATRAADWKEAFTIGSWSDYKYGSNFKDFAKKLGLNETVIDTAQKSTSEAAQMVLGTIG